MSNLRILLNMKPFQHAIKLLFQLFFLQHLVNIHCQAVNPPNTNNPQVRELIMSQVLFQNGAHYSDHGRDLIPDQLQQSQNILNKGLLTSVGMQQEYELGMKIRNTFKQFNGEFILSDNFNKNEIHMQSSNEDVSLQSAQSFLQGFYSTNQMIQLPKNIKLDLVIPPLQYNDQEKEEIKSRIESEKHLALPSQSFPLVIHSKGDREYAMDSPCPNKPKIIAKQHRQLRTTVRVEFERHSSDLKEISQKLKLHNPLTVLNIVKVSDIVRSQKYLGNDFQLTSKQYNLIQYLRVYSELQRTYTKDFSRLIASPTFDFIISNFDGKVKGESTLKVVFGSTNSSKFISLLVTLGLLDPKKIKINFDNNPSISIEELFPPFSSSLIFQLYQLNSGQQYEVEIQYNGKKVSICDGKSVSCEYEKFSDYLSAKMIDPREYGEICGFIDDPYQPANRSDIYLVVIIIVAVIAVVFAVAFTCQQYFIKQGKKQEQQQEKQKKQQGQQEQQQEQQQGP